MVKLISPMANVNPNQPEGIKVRWHLLGLFILLWLIQIAIIGYETTMSPLFIANAYWKGVVMVTYSVNVFRRPGIWWKKILNVIIVHLLWSSTIAPFLGALIFGSEFVGNMILAFYFLLIHNYERTRKSGNAIVLKRE